MVTNNRKHVLEVFGGLAIRDTVIHFPDESVDWLDGFDIDRVTFGIINELNQAVTIQPIGRAGGASGNLGSSTSVSANSEAIVSLNLESYWSPYIAVSAKCSVAPTSGKLTVYCIFRPRK